MSGRKFTLWVVPLWKALVGKPIRSVLNKVRMMKEGTYHLFASAEGGDDFSRLEADFNSMAEAVQARQSEKQSLMEELSRTNEDLTKEIALRRQWEGMLQEQKRFADALIQNSAVATFVLDRDHRVVLWNKACEILTGTPAAAIVGTNSQWKAFYPSKRPTLADLVLEGAEDLADLYHKYSRSALVPNGLHAEGWYQNLNGRDRYIIFDAAPVFGGGRELIAAIETLQDVTEQKNMERALARSEARFRTIIETQPECVKLVGPDGTILEINRAGLAMLDADSPAGIVGKSMMQFVVPEHVPAVQKHFENSLKGESNLLEFEITGLKGSRRWVESRAALLPDDQGEVFAVLLVTRDVTARKRGERKLQEQVQFMQTLMDTIPMPVFYKDVRGLYLGGNKAFGNYIGIPIENMVGKSVYDVAPKQLADEYNRKDRELFANPGVQIYDFTVKRADGSVRDVIFNKATYIDAKGNVAGLIGVILDITDRKKAEETLRQTNQTLETLINASPTAIQVLDPGGRITLWNPAAERLFGWTAEEALGHTNPIVPENKKEEFTMLRERVLWGEAFSGFEVQRQKKDGSLVDLSLSTAPLLDSAGRVTGILALITDITARKRAEAEIRRHYDTQTAINWILHISLENMPIEKIMKQALDLILSIPWLSFESRGAVFLVEQKPDVLILKAERGLPDSLKEKCGSVPFGRCLCGRAAARGDMQFAADLDERHEVTYADIAPHGHYCVPIKHAGTVLGVITIYLRSGHELHDKEAEFLRAIANALAGVIRRSKAEAALQESEKRYRTLAEAAHDVIFIVDRKGRLNYVNSYGANLFNTSSRDLTGKSVAQLFPNDIAERQLNLARVFESGASHYVENPFQFSGAEVWLGTWLVPLKNEDQTVGSVLGVARDVTERKRSEQERESLIQELQKALITVSHSQKEWQETFDSITDMITIIDKEFRIIKANKAFAAYFGFHPREMVNTKCHHFYHETGYPAANCPHLKTIAEKKAFSAEVSDKKTGKVLRITTFPYVAPDGEVIGSIHVSRDVTDEKEQEMRLIMTERLAALGQMASGIAHEINNPLASIAGCSEGLLGRIRKGQCDYKLFETYLNIIQEEIFRCKSITTAMLSFVRKTTYEKKEVRVDEMLDRTVEIISFQGRLKDVKIVRNYQGSGPAAQANEGELRQVCLAVLANALDAMEDQGTLTLETGASESRAFIRIGDTGPGISEEGLTKIFDPFYTTKSERGGTGLGLSIARKIIHNHNGNIEVSSEPGKGTVFTIIIPI